MCYLIFLFTIYYILDTIFCLLGILNSSFLLSLFLHYTLRAVRSTLTIYDILLYSTLILKFLLFCKNYVIIITQIIIYLLRFRSNLLPPRERRDEYENKENYLLSYSNINLLLLPNRKLHCPQFIYLPSPVKRYYKPHYLSICSRGN